MREVLLRGKRADNENDWGKDFEVIGNIHDDPELLEEGDDNA